jgi:hypothetical protein
MDSPNTQVGRFELAARALDLTTALREATSSSNSRPKGAWEIGQWLGRERLNQHELLHCTEKAKGLAYGNKNGLHFFDKVIRGLDPLRVPVEALFSQQSASLSRLIVGDPNLSWIVSTVAGLFQHHKHDRVVTSKLAALIMESYRVQEGGNDVSQLKSMIHNAEHARVTAVVRKIVSSVWYNVVNAGCDAIPLPQELLDLRPRGHYLEPEDFGAVISNIHARCRSKAVLRTDHLLRDVLMWLLLHYEDTILVNVGGRIVYRAELGSPYRELEVRIPSTCSGDSGCGGARAEPYRILHHISGKFEELLSGASSSDPAGDLPPRPGVRQKLYEVPRPYPIDSPIWNKGLQTLVKCTAQSIMRWLLGVPLSAQAYSSDSSPGFSAGPGLHAAEDDTTVAVVLKRIPAMVNLQWGSLPSCHGAIMSPSVETSLATERRLLMLLEYFLILVNMVKRVAGKCLCPGCSGRCPILGGLPAGCLKRTAVEEVFLLLAHGIADGFGVNDVSSVSETGPIVEGVITLLEKLVSARKVCWNTWFAVAPSVCIGCPFENSVPASHSDDFVGTSFAAIQFGNLATSTPWLDLTQQLAVRGCFALVGSKGRLGVITKSNSQPMQFRTIGENFAVIQTEKTEDTSWFCSHNTEEASIVDRTFPLEEDESEMKSDVILYQADDRFYRLLLRIKTQTHWRVVDPSDAFSAVTRMLPSARCHH